MGLDNLKVTCYSEHAYAKKPESFIWRGGAYQIKEIEKEWLEPRERRFQVLTGDSKLFQLCYNTKEQQWSIIALVRGKA